LAHLAAIGSISKTQARAGMRLRTAYELGVIGMTKCAIERLGHVQAQSGPSDGPSEIRLINLGRFNAAKEAAGRLWDVLAPVVLDGLSVREYCERYKVRRDAVSARLIAGLDVLVSHYERIDAPAKARAHG
jgi:hypothetical protein